MTSTSGTNGEPPAVRASSVDDVAAGRRLYVLRPGDPAREVARALAAHAAGDVVAASTLDPTQTYTYVGRLGPAHAIVDAEGQVLGPLEPGDTFVTSLAGLGKV